MSKLKFLNKSVVDADNIFNVFGLKYYISKSVKEYRVYNSYKENQDNFTNESQMSIVNVYIDMETNKLHFFNEHNKEITKIMIVEDN